MQRWESHPRNPGLDTKTCKFEYVNLGRSLISAVQGHEVAGHVADQVAKVRWHWSTGPVIDYCAMSTAFNPKSLQVDFRGLRIHFQYIGTKGDWPFLRSAFNLSTGSHMPRLSRRWGKAFGDNSISTTAHFHTTFKNDSRT